MTNHSPTPRRLRAAARTAARHCAHSLPPVFAMTDPVRTPDHMAFARNLPPGFGLIYRHFGAPDRDVVARQLRRLTYRRRLVLLIAADPELAIAIAADGVHWPERLSSEAVRFRDRFRIRTASSHSRSATRRLSKLGVFHAVMRSTVFPSASPSASSPMGAVRFRSEAMHANIRVYALGGVNADNASQVARFSGLAAIDGILQTRT